MSDLDPAGAVRAHLEAFSAGDLDTLLASLAPDAHFASGTTAVVPAEFAEFFGWAIRELSPTVRIKSLVAEGGQVACEFVESVTMDGRRQHLNRAAFYRVADGLITDVKVYDERE